MMTLHVKLAGLTEDAHDEDLPIKDRERAAEEAALIDEELDKMSTRL